MATHAEKYVRAPRVDEFFQPLIPSSSYHDLPLFQFARQLTALFKVESPMRIALRGFNRAQEIFTPINALPSLTHTPDRSTPGIGWDAVLDREHHLFRNLTFRMTRPFIRAAERVIGDEAVVQQYERGTVIKDRAPSEFARSQLSACREFTAYFRHAQTHAVIPVNFTNVGDVGKQGQSLLETALASHEQSKGAFTRHETFDWLLNTLGLQIDVLARALDLRDRIDCELQRQHPALNGVEDLGFTFSMPQRNLLRELVQDRQDNIRLAIALSSAVSGIDLPYDDGRPVLEGVLKLA